jgi:hypothetical protein
LGDGTSVLTVRLRLRPEGGGDGDALDSGEALEASDDRSELASSSAYFTSAVCAKLRRDRLGASPLDPRDDRASTTRAVSRDTLEVRILVKMYDDNMLTIASKCGGATFLILSLCQGRRHRLHVKVKLTEAVH